MDEIDLPKVLEVNGVKWSEEDARLVMLALMPVLRTLMPHWHQVYLGLPVSKHEPKEPV